MAHVLAPAPRPVSKAVTHPTSKFHDDMFFPGLQEDEHQKPIADFKHMECLCMSQTCFGMQ